jgi:hypothetical protein
MALVFLRDMFRHLEADTKVALCGDPLCTGKIEALSKEQAPAFGHGYRGLGKIKRKDFPDTVISKGDGNAA